MPMQRHTRKTPVPTVAIYCVSGLLPLRIGISQLQTRKRCLALRAFQQGPCRCRTDALMTAENGKMTGGGITPSRRKVSLIRKRVLQVQLTVPAKLRTPSFLMPLLKALSKSSWTMNSMTLPMSGGRAFWLPGKRFRGKTRKRISQRKHAAKARANQWLATSNTDSCHDPHRNCARGI